MNHDLLAALIAAPTPPGLRLPAGMLDPDAETIWQWWRTQATPDPAGCLPDLMRTGRIRAHQWPHTHRLLVDALTTDEPKPLAVALDQAATVWARRQTHMYASELARQATDPHTGIPLLSNTTRRLAAVLDRAARLLLDPNG